LIASYEPFLFRVIGEGHVHALMHETGGVAACRFGDPQYESSAHPLLCMGDATGAGNNSQNDEAKTAPQFG